MIRLLLFFCVLSALPAASQTAVSPEVVDAIWDKGLEAAELASDRADDAFRDPRLDSLTLANPRLDGIHEGDLAWLDSLVASGGVPPTLSVERERDVRSRLANVSHLAALASGMLMPVVAIETARATPGPDGVDAALREQPGNLDPEVYLSVRDLVYLLADAGDETERIAASGEPLGGQDATDWAGWAAEIRQATRRVRAARAAAAE